jgi:type IV pilus assembly protein PilA
VGVIIIGILSAIAVPVYLSQRISAWKSTVVSDVHNAAKQVELASYNKNGSITGLAQSAYQSSDDVSSDDIGTILKKFTYTHNASNLIGDQPVNITDGNTIDVEIGDKNAYIITGVNTNVNGWVYKYSSIRGNGSWEKTEESPVEPTAEGTAGSGYMYMNGKYTYDMQPIDTGDSLRVTEYGVDNTITSYRVATDAESSRIDAADKNGTLGSKVDVSGDNSGMLYTVRMSGFTNSSIIKDNSLYYVCGQLTTINGKLVTTCPGSQAYTWVSLETKDSSTHGIILPLKKGTVGNYMLTKFSNPDDTANCRPYTSSSSNKLNTINGIISACGKTTYEMHDDGDYYQGAGYDTSRSFFKLGADGSVVINENRNAIVPKSRLLLKNFSTTKSITVTNADGSKKTLKPGAAMYVDIDNSKDYQVTSDSGFSITSYKG